MTSSSRPLPHCSCGVPPKKVVALDVLVMFTTPKMDSQRRMTCKADEGGLSFAQEASTRFGRRLYPQGGQAAVRSGGVRLVW